MGLLFLFKSIVECVILGRLHNKKYGRGLPSGASGGRGSMSHNCNTLTPQSSYYGTTFLTRVRFHVTLSCLPFVPHLSNQAIRDKVVFAATLLRQFVHVQCSCQFLSPPVYLPCSFQFIPTSSMSLSSPQYFPAFLFSTKFCFLPMSFLSSLLK